MSLSQLDTTAFLFHVSKVIIKPPKPIMLMVYTIRLRSIWEWFTIASLT